MHDAKLVHEQLCSIARTRLELHAREARLLVLAEELELWRHFGCVTLFEYLERFCDLQPRTAREYLRVARALTALPVMRDMLDARRINYSTARELTRVATPDNETAWLRAVAGLSAREIEEEVAGRAHGDGPDAPKDPDRLVKLVLEVRESTYAAFVDARCRYMDERGERLSDDEVVLAMCHERAEAEAEAEPEPEAEPVRAAAAYQLSITTCRSCLKSFLLAAGREVEVPPSLFEAARCDARFIGDLEADTPPRALSSVTPRMREQVLARDRNTCTVPGCRSKRFLEIHHVKFESLGGPNVASNLTAACFGHHAQLHAGKLAVSGQAPYALSWSWPDDPTRNSTRRRFRFDNEPCVREGAKTEVGAVVRGCSDEIEMRDVGRGAGDDHVTAAHDTAHVGHGFGDRFEVAHVGRGFGDEVETAHVGHRFGDEVEAAHVGHETGVSNDRSG